MGVAACRMPDALRSRLPGRPVRVCIALALIALLSLADLLLTLIYVTEIGLIEENPVARRVMQTGGPSLLVAAKLASVAVCVGILWWARARAISEAAAIFGLVVLCWLTVRWIEYTHVFSTVSASMEELELHGGQAWVTLAEVKPN